MNIVTTAKNIATRKSLATFGAGGMIGVAAMIPFLPTDNPPDPRFPNPMIGWCPGGGAGGLTGYGFCDGVRYPDGSYWHIIRGDVPFVGSQMRMDCVVMVPDNPIPQLAPRGGCGGAVQ